MPTFRRTIFKVIQLVWHTYLRTIFIGVCCGRSFTCASHRLRTLTIFNVTTLAECSRVCVWYLPTHQLNKLLAGISRIACTKVNQRGLTCIVNPQFSQCNGSEFNEMSYYTERKMEEEIGDQQPSLMRSTNIHIRMKIGSKIFWLHGIVKLIKK